MKEHLSEIDEKYIRLFFEKIAIKNECWEWTGARNDKGYGVAWDGNKTQKAHRFSYMIRYGKMPRTCVLHRCDNPRCVNPDHLFLGTRADNNIDMIKKGRRVCGGRKTGVANCNYERGENHHAAKLDSNTILLIIEERKLGKSYGFLANKYNTVQSNIYKICAGKAWKNVTRRTAKETGKGV